MHYVQETKKVSVAVLAKNNQDCKQLLQMYNQPEVMINSWTIIFVLLHIFRPDKRLDFSGLVKLQKVIWRKNVHVAMEMGMIKRI